MAGVFGGDSSVVWKVDANRVRETKVLAKGKVHRHEGTDETTGGRFTVRIRVPRDEGARQKFVAQVEAFLKNKPNTLEVSFPIEDIRYAKSQKRRPLRAVRDQIKVDWP
jgi:hypothetical protein